jgi:hypothetical protein
MLRLIPVDGSGDFQSTKIKATLTGRISNIWVYWSSRRARANVVMRAFHQIVKENAARMEKIWLGENLKLDCRPEVLRIESLLCWR